MNPHQIVEAVLFASDAPITADEIARADEHLDEDQVEMAIRQLQAEYDDAERSFQIAELAEGYQILTRSEFAPYLERFDNVPRPSRLSGPALETLAIIAYRQPLGRMEIEYIRGVGAQGVLKTLLDREMIEVVGRAEGLGRPVLYGTTRKFLEHFGLKSLEDLPHPEELPVVLRERIPLGPEELQEGEGEEAEGEGGEEDDGAAAAAAPPDAEDVHGVGEAGETTPDTEDVHGAGDAGETTVDLEEVRRADETGEAPSDPERVSSTGDAGRAPPGAPGEEEATVGGETPADDILP